MTSSERVSEESREYPTVKPGDTVTIEVTDIDGRVYRTKCQIADSTAPHKAECGYCKDCKWWWVAPSAEKTGPEVWRFAKDGYGICFLFQTYDGGRDKSEVSMAYAFSLHTQRGMMATKPDFGCVQWETKYG